MIRTKMLAMVVSGLLVGSTYHEIKSVEYGVITEASTSINFLAAKDAVVRYQVTKKKYDKMKSDLVKYYITVFGGMIAGGMIGNIIGRNIDGPADKVSFLTVGGVYVGLSLGWVGGYIWTRNIPYHWYVYKKDLIDSEVVARVALEKLTSEELVELCNDEKIKNVVYELEKEI